MKGGIKNKLETNDLFHDVHIKSGISFLPKIGQLHGHLNERVRTAVATFHERFSENLESENFNVHVLVQPLLWQNWENFESKKANTNVKLRNVFCRLINNDFFTRIVE